MTDLESQLRAMIAPLVDEAPEETEYLDCEQCGSSIGTGLYQDGQEMTCAECGAVNVASMDEEIEPYVGSWKCAHGRSGDEACDLCEIEHGGGVGEQGAP